MLALSCILKLCVTPPEGMVDATLVRFENTHRTKIGDFSQAFVGAEGEVACPTNYHTTKFFK